MLKDIQEWAKKGYLIEYYIVDQIENGYKHDVETGDKPRYTFTSTILHNDVRIFIESHDTVEEALQSAIDFMNESYVFEYKLRDKSVHTIKSENIYEAMTQIVMIHKVHPTTVEYIQEKIVIAS